MEIITTGCVHDCGGRCVLKVHVEGGRIVKIATDEGHEPQLRACLRGRAYRQRVYAPDRLKYPLRRTGERGEAEFERVSWDEALDAIADNMLRIKKEQGTEAILELSGPGNISLLHVTAHGTLRRLLNLFGGCVRTRGTMSFSAAMSASQYTLGTTYTGNDLEDLYNSRLIILWGWNPVDTIHGTNTAYVLKQAKEKGIKIICIDPRYTDTVALLADKWIPIYPATDTAMLVAMAYVIIDRGLQDREFIKTHTIGFDKFEDYVMGRQDGTPKSPSWAQSITGVEARAIEDLALEYASAKPAALMMGWGVQRTAYGEQSIRAGITLAAMTASIGISGGSAAGFYWSENLEPARIGKLPALEPPSPKTVPVNKWADAILLGRKAGYPSDVKMAYSIGRNILNQVPTVAKGIEALKKLEFFVVHEQFMTATARFADIVLPVTTWFERTDITATCDYALFMPKVIEPMYECKSDLQIFTELAPRLGINGYNDLTEEQWLKGFVEKSEIGDYEDFKKKGVYWFKKPAPRIAFKAQIERPASNPFPTPSGKIEIYSAKLDEMGQPDLIPPIPKYIEPWEGRRDPLTGEYPLQLITPHSKRLAHSTYANIPWLQEVEDHEVWINPLDAANRDLRDGSMVKVHNARGALLVKAKLTERIMPGVVSIFQGVWYRPGKGGVDVGGCVNVLNRDEDTPLGDGATTHSCLVEVSKA